MQADRQFQFGNGMTLVPTLQLGWMHELADTNAKIDAAFLEANDPSFEVASVSAGRDAAVLGFGTTLHTGGPLSLYLDYKSTLNGPGKVEDLTGDIQASW